MLLVYFFVSVSDDAPFCAYHLTLLFSLFPLLPTLPSLLFHPKSHSITYYRAGTHQLIGPGCLLPEEEEQEEEMVDLQVATHDEGLRSFKLRSNFVWTVLLAIKIFI